jgi:hypothetical protein
MKTPPELVKSIYLGDRFCKRIGFEGMEKRLKIEVNTISRIRDPGGSWNYYSAEDITDGTIVFEHVTLFSLTPEGPIPNDWISFVRVEPIAPTDPALPQYCTVLSLGAVTEDGRGEEMTLKIVSRRMYLTDPKRPGVEITD